ncbi:hypothetical protein [Tumebacillus lipolyticus]|uniref:Uncharacterized protein n=1 Tax=Tumebacillus lipolyticus TaxID=1280370 RepID=A0ABW4ZRK5_9BACL
MRFNKNEDGGNTFSAAKAQGKKKRVTVVKPAVKQEKKGREIANQGTVKANSVKSARGSLVNAQSDARKAQNASSAELVSAHQQNEELQNKLKKVHSRNQTLEYNLSQLESKIHQLKVENDELRRLYKKMKETEKFGMIGHNLPRQSEELLSKMKELQSENRALREEIRMQRSILENQKHEGHEKFLAQIESFQKTNEALVAQIQALQVATVKTPDRMLVAEIEELRKAIEELNSQMEDLEETNEKLEDAVDNEELVSEIESLRKSIKKLHKKMEKQEALIQPSPDSLFIETILTEIESLRGLNEELNVQIEQLQSLRSQASAPEPVLNEEMVEVERADEDSEEMLAPIEPLEAEYEVAETVAPEPIFSEEAKVVVAESEEESSDEMHGQVELVEEESGVAPELALDEEAVAVAESEEESSEEMRGQVELVEEESGVAPELALDEEAVAVAESEEASSDEMHEQVELVEEESDVAPELALDEEAITVAESEEASSDEMHEQVELVEEESDVAPELEPNDGLVAEMETLRRDYAILQSQIGSRPSDDERQPMFTDTDKTLQDRIDAMQNEMKYLTAENQGLQNNLDRLQRMVKEQTSLQKHYQNLLASQDELSKKNDGLNKKMEILITKNETLRKEVEVAKYETMKANLELWLLKKEQAKMQKEDQNPSLQADRETMMAEGDVDQAVLPQPESENHVQNEVTEDTSFAPLNEESTSSEEAEYDSIFSLKGEAPEVEPDPIVWNAIQDAVPSEYAIPDQSFVQELRQEEAAESDEQTPPLDQPVEDQSSDDPSPKKP